MCESYPVRRTEMDKYQTDIIDMSQRFTGGAFYEYHRAFSAKSAALLLNYNIKLDWSRRDTTLFCSIFSGLRANACTICTSVAHSTEFCPQINSQKSNNNALGNYRQGVPSGGESRTDSKINTVKSKSQGYARYGNFPSVNGREICQNWNKEKGCIFTATECKYVHVCNHCKSSQHSAIRCNESMRSRPTLQAVAVAPKSLNKK